MGAALFPAHAGLAARCGGDALVRLLTEADEEELRLTHNAQPALAFTGIALAADLREAGLEPVAVAGHSVGEYTALAVAGVLTAEAAVAAVTERGRAMAEAVPAGETSLVAVLGLAPEAVEAAVEPVEECWPANYNTPTQTVVGGRLAALEAATERLGSAGARRVLPLNVSAAFHTPLVAPAAERLRRHLDQLQWRPLSIPVAANLTGELYGEDADFPAVLERQLRSPVRWSGCVEALSRLGVTDFVEVGPKRALTGMLRELAPSAGAHAVATPEAARELAAKLLQ